MSDLGGFAAAGARGSVPKGAATPPNPSSEVTVDITRDPISIARSEALVMSSQGAMVVFVGYVRDTTMGRAVTGLEYEAYEELAYRQMHEIGLKAAGSHGADILLVHRTGSLVPGEISVLVAAAAPHRRAAFEACEYCIEELKQSAAIWKKEQFSDGESTWVNHP